MVNVIKTDSLDGDILVLGERLLTLFDYTTQKLVLIDQIMCAAEEYELNYLL